MGHQCDFHKPTHDRKASYTPHKALYRKDIRLHLLLQISSCFMYVLFSIAAKSAFYLSAAHSDQQEAGVLGYQPSALWTNRRWWGKAAVKCEYAAWLLTKTFYIHWSHYSAANDSEMFLNNVLIALHVNGIRRSNETQPIWVSVKRSLKKLQCFYLHVLIMTRIMSVQQTSRDTKTSSTITVQTPPNW